MFKRLTSGQTSLPARCRSAASLAALAATLGLAGCVSDGRMNSFAQGSLATVAFDTIDGPPPQVFERLVEALNAEAQAKSLPVVSREGTATYRVRAYLAAQVSRGRTSIAWTFDVYEAGQQRALRLTGEEPAGRAGRDAWAVADAQLLRRIAQSGVAGMAQLVNGTLPAEAPGQPVPARGPAIAQSPEPAPVSSQTVLAFRRE